MQLFYHPEISEASTEVVFSKDESRHIAKVLRKQVGNELRLTNGLGTIFTVRLIATDPKRCLASLVASEEVDPLPYHLHMAVAPTKLNDRYEWFLEKATEIGISEITPICCERSERRTIKTERYNKIILSALKQSLKAHLPVLHELNSFDSFLKSTETFEGQKYVAHCNEGDKSPMQKVVTPHAKTLILIGPEGDFSEKEVQKAIDYGFIPVSLGNSRLRTETAAIVACHSIAMLNEPI